ncbi:ATP-binding protein [Acidianus sp. DSM 29099]|nr:ATP-binding protein [Acidianus sp. RZ1]
MMMKANRIGLEKKVKTITYVPTVSWDQIFDNREVKNRLREISEEVNKGRTYGVILFGPPGTGKTTMAKAIANALNWKFVELKASNIMSKWYGESEFLLSSFLDSAEKEQPVVLFIDEIDSFAMQRGDTHEVTHRLTNILLTKLQEFHDKNDKILIIGATNIPQEIDEAFLRPGRFDEIIYVPLPDLKGREEIWEGYAGNVDTLALAKRSQRFSPADIKLIAEEVKNKAEKEGRTPSTQDFLKALEEYKPSIQISTIVKFEDLARKYSRRRIDLRLYGIPQVTWDELGDLEDVKAILRDEIEIPIKNKEFAQKLQIKPVKGILLYGPPGTGKTSLAKAMANELSATFILLSGEEISSAGPMESPQLIAEKFNIARDYSPSIIFVDEIDMIAKNRSLNEWRNALTELLTQLDGIRENEDIVVVGATNRPWDLDPAIIRPGRLERLIYVPPPDMNGRIKVIKVLSRGIDISDEEIQWLAERTERYTPADLKLIIDELKRSLLKEAHSTGFLRTRVNLSDLENALSKVKASVDLSSLSLYDNFSKRFL